MVAENLDGVAELGAERFDQRAAAALAELTRSPGIAAQVAFPDEVGEDGLIKVGEKKSMAFRTVAKGSTRSRGITM